MPLEIKDQAILITGAGRGLGRSLAMHLAGLGATVGVTDIDAAASDDTLRAITETGGTAFTYTADVGKRVAGEGLGEIEEGVAPADVGGGIAAAG